MELNKITTSIGGAIGYIGLISGFLINIAVQNAGQDSKLDAMEDKFENYITRVEAQEEHNQLSNESRDNREFFSTEISDLDHTTDVRLIKLELR